MQFGFAEHFFQSLSFALLNSIWQMALLWLLFLCLNFKKENNPQFKFIVLVFFQAIGFVWFLQTFISSYINSQTIGSAFNFTIVQNGFLNDVLFFVGVLYMFFVAYHVALFLLGIQSIVQIKNKNRQTSLLDYDLFVQKMSTSLGIATQVLLKVSNKIATPLTIGIFKPIILIPLAAINALTPTQMEAIILHELAHIKRKDYLINLLLLAIDVFMFFNPFSKMIKKQIFFERELCCDDIVLHHQFNNNVYANALVNIASLQLQKNSSSFAINAVSEKHELLKRIQRILGFNVAVQNKSYKISTLVFALIIGLFTLSISSNSKTKLVVQKNKISVKPIIENEVIKVEKHFVTSDVVLQKKQTSFLSKKIVTNDVDKTSDLKNDLVETLNYFKPVENHSSYFAYNNDEVDVNTNAQQEPIVVTSAIKKYPIITTQKFFIPATSSKPASVIIVTTTEKEAGNKVVQIDIVKGTGTVE